MSGHTPPSEGRRAIDWIKSAYLEGRSFASTAALITALSAESVIRANRIRQGAALDWDRQARYELAAQYKTFVTPPVASEAYLRTPSAAPRTRVRTMATRKRYLSTAISNLTLMQAAAAAQVDATRSEIQDESEIRMACTILQSVRARMDRTEREQSAVSDPVRVP